MPALDTLPLEILFQIFNFISGAHNPSSLPFHPLDSLAAASKQFDSAVEEYARALLKQRANYAPQKKSKTYTSRRRWLAETCQICYKKSKRRSTLWKNLTCCLVCDKFQFPKVVCSPVCPDSRRVLIYVQTMTNAIKQYELSKLDIFTPNRLHPTLPPLAHGEYSVMGGLATSTLAICQCASRIANSLVIYEPDLVARRDTIHGCLSDVDRLETNLRKRIRRQERLVAHMEIAYCARRKLWYRSPRILKDGEKPGRASMLTKEGRDEFVRKALEQERAAMRMKGTSEGAAIEID